MEFVADAISRIYIEEEIDQNTLTEINQNIDELFSEVLKVDIDQTIKIYILNSLNEISNAIRNYQIFGAEGIKDSLAKVLGNTLIEKEQIKNHHRMKRKCWIKR